MIRNENGPDRLGRITLGIALLLLVFVGPKTPWGLLGLVPLITGVIGYCPLYQLVGWSSCRRPKGA